MTRRRAHRHADIKGLFLYLGAYLLGISALAQTDTPLQNLSPSPKGQPEIFVGCLIAVGRQFQLSDEEDNDYLLTGRTSGPEKYPGEEISVQGTKDESARSIVVVSFKEVFRAPDPKLSSTLSDPSKWDLHRTRSGPLVFEPGVAEYGNHRRIEPKTAGLQEFGRGADIRGGRGTDVQSFIMSEPIPPVRSFLIGHR